MKRIILVLSILIGTSYYGSAQSVAIPSDQQNKIADPTATKILKAAMMRAMHPNTADHSSANRKSKQVPANPHTLTTSGCSCDISLDSSFAVVPFTGGPICSGCPGVPPDYRNDDSWTGTPINLPFNFCFYGTTYNQVYINNNGNLTFGTYESDYTSLAFPIDTVMIAPYWADVDTRDPGSGLVYYKLTATALIVKWDSVGYFDENSDLVNTFQVIITNGSDPMIPNGNNVSFCYGEMQWTSGDASNGTGGLNGDPATVGANAGNGIDYIQFGTFDHAGTDYYGGYGAPSGVEWLNGKHFDFNSCNGGNNIQPSQQGIPTCDTIALCPGDTLNLPAYFFSPEINQTTHVNITTPPGLLGWTVFYNASGSPDSISAQLIANSANSGINVITFTAIDNGIPNDTSIFNLVILINNSSLCGGCVISANFVSSDTVFCDESGKCIDFTDFSTCNPTSWKWHFPGAIPDSSILQNPTNICYYTPGSYPVSLIASNGLGTDSLVVTPLIVMTTAPFPPTTFISNDTIYCSHAAHYQWYLNGSPIPGATNSFYVFHTSFGTYSVQISDGTGCNSLSGGILITSVSSLAPANGGIELYPNPAANELIIKRNQSVDIREIEIYNVLGEKIYSKNTEFAILPSIFKINTSGFFDGIYFIRIFTAGGELNNKFIIKK